MHTFFTRSLTLTALTLAVAGSAFASQAAKPAAPQKPAAVTSRPAKTTPKAGATSHSATGTIAKFDSNMLTLKTASGEEQFTLGSAARVQNGSKTIKADDLSSLTGERAKVRYTESNGQKTAESVMVSSGARTPAGKGKTIQ